MTLTDKVALITGGGTGIGREISLVFAQEGAHLVLNYSRSETEATETAQQIQALGVPASTIQADVSQDAQVRTMVKQVKEEYGRLDLLVNNAGTTAFIEAADLEAVTEDVWDRILAVNVKGTFFCSRAAMPVLKEQGGCIINIASVAGISGVGSSIPYAASKAAIINLTKSLARAFAPEVRVNAIAPGFVDTRWTAHWSDRRAEQVQITPMGRVAQPEDVAKGALYLARSEFVTGQTIVIDGGRTI